MASRTTNSLSPALKVHNDSFSIENATVTQVHVYTSSQGPVDYLAKKLRRGRSAAASLITYKHSCCLDYLGNWMRSQFEFL